MFMGSLKRFVPVLAIISLGWMGAASALGQAAQPPANGAAAAAPAPVPERQAPVVQTAAQNPEPPIGITLQRNGGSLARAQLTNQPDPATTGASSVSYFAVAAPQPKLVHKHDIITIVVNEQSTFSSIGLTDLKHSSDLDAQIDAYLNLKLASLRLAQVNPTTPFELKGTSARDFKGEATVNRADALTTQISAEVIDVKPNGTIVLEANTRIKTDEEEQKIVLTGVCRVEDITADNTVISTQLSNLDLKKTHTGAVRDTTERGFIPRILDTINPF
jgi:flagellar L-ring protein precursor FlgH